ncbi:hypothetical protein CISIN_1g025471mg [Citrus sinensis]|uniref:DUF674 domain-containing protein n=1 Tax=Citrus sinensis TaxID=2711 RepID=A0A067FK37_CITSI|nr:hypothetical protein CISIN_1g025471mg [Citrus sinensis]
MATATTTSNTETTKVKLKLIIDKRANKVLFAEAEKDFVDSLFNLLYMPFGTVTRLLRDAVTVGCTGNLYQSLENLSEAVLITNHSKVELLKPLLKWEKPSVLLQPQACPPPVPVERKLYNCGNNHRYVTNQANKPCPQCYSSQSYEVRQSNMVSESESGIVKKSIAYTVTDDLSVTPGSMILGIGLLQGNIKDTGALKEKVVDIGPDEVLELLNASMQTNEALTTVFLPREEKVSGMKIMAPIGPQIPAPSG